MDASSHADPTFFTVWFHGHPYPVSVYPGSASLAGSSWYVLHADGRWYRVRERRESDGGPDGWRVLEADVVAWLEEHHASPPEPEPLPAGGGRYMLPPRHLRAPTVRRLAFDDGWQASDFVRRLGVLFDGRTTRLIVPSMPMVIYGPALMPVATPVTLYAGRGAIALARYLGLPFPNPGDEVDVATLNGLSVLFGPISQQVEAMSRSPAGSA